MDQGTAIAADLFNGGAYAIGYVGAALPGQKHRGSSDVFVRRYDFLGNEVWTRQFGTSGEDEGWAAACRIGSGVLVGGWTTGSFSGQPNLGGKDAILMAIGDNGDSLLALQFGTGGGDEIEAIVVDIQAAVVYVSGIAGTGLEAGGTTGAFLRKYHASGAVLWTRQFGMTIGDHAHGLSLDSAGNIYVAGYTFGTFPGETNFGGTRDNYVRKYDPDGNHLWTRQFGTSSDEFAYSVSSSASGVYVGGETTGSFPGFANAGGWDAFVAKFDTNGNPIWTRQYGSAQFDGALGIAADALGFYVAGEAGALPGQVFEGGLADVYVRRYDADGNVLWTREFGTPGTDLAYRLSVGGANASNVYLAGYTTGTLSGQTSSGSLDAWVARFDARANLDVVSFTGPASAEIGEDISGSMSLTVRKISLPVAAPDTFSVGFYLSPDTIITTNDILLVGGREFVDMAESETRVIGINAGSIPETAVPGLQYLGVLVDEFGAVDEFDEADNTAWVPITITGQPGDFIWTRQFGTDSTDIATAVALDATGAYVAGWTDGPLGETLLGGNDAFVRKYDADGNVLWTGLFGTEASDRALGIAADGSGIYVVGRTEGTFEGITNQGVDAFLRKYDASGNVIWTRQFGTSGSDEATAVSAGAGGIYVAGWTGGAFSGETNAGSLDAFVRKYDAAGNAIWTRQFGSSGFDKVRGISTNLSGIYVTGEVSGTLPGEVSAGGQDAYVRKYDVDGNVVWTRQFGTAGNEIPYGVSVHSSGVYAVGRSDGAFSGEVNLGSFDAFLRKFDTAGNALWTRQFGTAGLDEATAVFVRSTGVSVAGRAGGALPGQTFFGSNDAFVRQYDLSGSELWTRQFGTSSFDIATGVAANAGGVYTSGYTFGTLPGQTGFAASDAFAARLKTAASAPNLEIVLFNGPSEALVGQEIGDSIAVSIRNSGTEDVTGSFSVGLYTSFDSDIRDSDDLLDNGRVVINGILAGETKAVPVPSNAAIAQTESPIGNIFLGVIVDEFDVVAETNETDNTAARPIFVDADSDGDGVFDSADACPGEDASFFDADGDGCIDDANGARHVLYWGNEDLPLTYVIHQAGAPGITDGSDLIAVQNGVNAWTAIPSTRLSVNYGGTTPQKDARAADGINLVTFDDPDYLFGSAVLAVGVATSIISEPFEFGGRRVRPGQIVDADMIFNKTKKFKTSGTGPGTDIQSVATHEAAHLFGISHSAVKTSTMFFVLPKGTEASTLESDDRLVMLKAYADTTALAFASRLTGVVTHGKTGNPIAGAIVFAIDATSGDTLACEFTLPGSGRYTFLGLPGGDYFVAIYPLNGTSPIGGIVPAAINSLIASTAFTNFPPEYWDLGESKNDDPLAKDPIGVAQGVVTVANLITNIDEIPPFVTSVSPDSNATNVPVSGSIAISFSEPIATGSIAGNFSLRDSLTNQFVPGNAFPLNDDSLIMFVPTNVLAFETTYKLRLGTGIKDKFDNALADPFVAYFRTEKQPPISLSSLAPNSGVLGSTVVVSGLGFDSSPMNNTVSFNGVPANVLSASPIQLVVEVPQGATSGPLSVTNEVLQQTSAPLNFTVLSGEEVPKGFEVGFSNLGALPRSLTVLPDGKYAYVATDAGVSAVHLVPVVFGVLPNTPIPIAGGTDELDATPDGKRVYAVSRANRALYRINSDPASGGLFNQLIKTIALTDIPRGIFIEPSGQRAFVTTDVGQIQVWDVSGPSSSTFERQIGVITYPQANLRRKMAADPAGNYLLALTGSGKLLVYDLTTYSLLYEIPVGLDPRDVAVDPTGQRAYVCHETGQVSVVSLSGFFRVQGILTGGNLRGVSITPAGSFLYAANRELNILDVIGLQEGTPTFRKVAATIPQRTNPVDVDLSPDGLYAFSLSEAERRFVATAIGVGPVLKTLSRRAGPIGAIVVLTGEGFMDDSVTTVSFAGVSAGPVRRTQTTLTVAVPPGATSGPVVVEGRNSSGPVLKSNAIFFQVLGPTPPGAMRLAGKFKPAAAQGLTAAMAVSPTGDFVAIGDDAGNVFLFDTDAESQTFHQFLNFATPPGLSDVDDIAIAPDGKRAIIVSNGSAIVVNTNRFSSDFGALIGSVDFSGIGDSQVTNVVVSPDGRFAVFSDPSIGQAHIVELVPGEGGNFSVTASIGLDNIGLGLNGVVREMAYHPGGEYVYLPVLDSTPAALLVLDMRPESESYQSIITTTQLPAGTPSEIPIALSFTPDGSRCLILTTQNEGVPNRTLLTFNTANAANPILVGPHPIGGTSSPVQEHVRVSPRGDRATYDIVGSGFSRIDISGSPPYPVVDQLFDFLNLARINFDYAADAAKLYATSVFRDSLFVYDFSAAATIAKESGDNQTGVVDQALSAPLRVRVLTSGAQPVAGVPVSFSVTSGGGVFVSNNLPARVVGTDAQGFASVEWKLGSLHGVNSQTVEVVATGLSGSPITFTASAVQDPNTLPLTFSSVVPAAGATGVSITTATLSTFSRAVDPQSLSASTFSLREGANPNPVPTVVGLTDGNRKVSLTPVSPLKTNTTYTIHMTAGILDAAGGPLQNPTSASFTTSGPPPLVLNSLSPQSGTVGVGVVISGTGFDPVAANNTVRFNDVVAFVKEAGQDFLKVSVPLGAVSGEVRVTVGAQTSNALNFTVLVPTTSPVDQVLATVGTGSSTHSISITPDGARAYAVSPGANAVVPIDLETQVSMPAIPVGENPFAIVIDPEGNFAYVANLITGTVSLIGVNPARPQDYNRVVDTIIVGTAPVDLAVTPDGDRLIVANAGSSDLTVIDADSSSATHHQVLATVGTGSSTHSISITPDGGLLYVGTNSGYIVLDAVSYGVLATVGTGSSTHSISITPDGTLLVLLTTEGEVLIIDIAPGSLTENQVLATVGTGSSTHSISITPDGALLYLIQEEDDLILVISLELPNTVSVIEDGVILPPNVFEATIVDTLTAGEDPSHVAFDPRGTGRNVVTNAGDNTVTVFDPAGPPLVIADIRVMPRTLNLKSRGRFITGRIELPAEFDPRDIAISTVRLQDTVPALPDKWSIEDGDLDSIEELVVKFDRILFQDVMPQGEFVPVHITGKVLTRSFMGRDTIRTIRPTVTFPVGGEVLPPGQTVTVRWRSPAGFSVDSVDVYWTPNDGEVWYPIVRGVPDVGSAAWPVPNAAYDSCRVMVTLYGGGTDLGQGMSPGMFRIEVPLAVTLHSFNGVIDKGAAVLRWVTLAESNLRGFHILRSAQKDAGYARITEAAIPSEGSSGGAAYEFRDATVRPNQTYYYMLEEVGERATGQRFGPYKVVYAAVFSLEQNAPNPFNPTTKIGFMLPHDGRVILTVYDVGGRRVRTLVDEQRRADYYEVEWDGRDGHGQLVSSGVYFYRLEAGKFIKTRKMVMLK